LSETETDHIGLKMLHYQAATLVLTNKALVSSSVAENISVYPEV
jgi:hypothetical protein